MASTRPCTGDATSGASVRTTSPPTCSNGSWARPTRHRPSVIPSPGASSSCAIRTPRRGRVDGRPRVAPPGAALRGPTRRARCSTCSCTASETPRWASSCVAIAGRRPRGCWAEPPTSTPTCGRARRRSRTCGSRRGPKASVSGGSPCSAPKSWRRSSVRPPASRRSAGSASAGPTSGHPSPDSSAPAGRRASRCPTWCSSSAGTTRRHRHRPPACRRRPPPPWWRPGTSPTCC